MDESYYPPGSHAVVALTMANCRRDGVPGELANERYVDGLAKWRYGNSHEAGSRAFLLLPQLAG
jgi:hypothetical protein